MRHPASQYQACLFIIKLLNRKNCSLLLVVKRSGNLPAKRFWWKSCRSHPLRTPTNPVLNLFPLGFAKGLYNLCWNYVICNPSLPMSVFYCSTASLGKLFIVQAELPLSKLPGSASWALENGSGLSSTCQPFFGELKMDVKCLPDLHPKPLPKDSRVLLK